MALANDYVVALEKYDDETWNVVGDGLFRYNQDKAGIKRTPYICAVARSGTGTVIGAVYGNSNWDMFDIDVVWVAEEFRGQKLGGELLRLGEAEAIRRGCKIAVLFTFSFQARGFYEKQGYQVFGQLDGYPAGHATYWMSKKLL